MPGLDIASGNGLATVYPKDYDPLTVAVERLTSATDLLTRIALALENRAAEQDVILTLQPSTGPGQAGSTPNQLGYPRIRGKYIMFLPSGTGDPVIRYGSADIIATSIQTVPVAQLIPFPFVWQEGNDILLYDATAPTAVPAYTALIIGTTE